MGDEPDDAEGHPLRGGSAEDRSIKDLDFVPPDELYFRTAVDLSADPFFNRPPWPSRAPYQPGKQMCHGADYYPRFKEFVEHGGLGQFKNALVMNIRINDLHSLDIQNGSYVINFFLDLAYWVPYFDDTHFGDPSTIGTFAKYDPILDFPYFMETRWIRRMAEFSKRPGARRHECQLGQTFETVPEMIRRSRIISHAHSPSNKAGTRTGSEDAPPGLHKAPSGSMTDNPMMHAGLPELLQRQKSDSMPSGQQRQGRQLLQPGTSFKYNPSGLGALQGQVPSRGQCRSSCHPRRRRACTLAKALEGPCY